ncbi:MAG: hypothetical protein ACFFC7_34310 [Candidatus Hermodarchaeota archaeon]
MNEVLERMSDCLIWSDQIVYTHNYGECGERMYKGFDKLTIIGRNDV